MRQIRLWILGVGQFRRKSVFYALKQQFGRSPKTTLESLSASANNANDVLVCQRSARPEVPSEVYWFHLYTFEGFKSAAFTEIRPVEGLIFVWDESQAAKVAHDARYKLCWGNDIVPVHSNISADFLQTLQSEALIELANNRSRNRGQENS
jgi:hypothetical protein